jgi:hypothetical protein
MANNLKSMEVIIYDYLRSSQAERYKANFNGTTTGSITFSDSTVLNYTSISQLDTFIAKAKSSYSGIINEYSGDWGFLANQAKSMIEDLLVEGEFNNDQYTAGDGITYTRRPVTALMQFIDYCQKKATEEQSFTNGGIVGVINVP